MCEPARLAGAASWRPHTALALHLYAPAAPAAPRPRSSLASQRARVRRAICRSLRRRFCSLGPARCCAGCSVHCSTAADPATDGPACARNDGSLHTRRRTGRWRAVFPPGRSKPDCWSCACGCASRDSQRRWPWERAGGPVWPADVPGVPSPRFQSRWPSSGSGAAAHRSGSCSACGAVQRPLGVPRAFSAVIRHPPAGRQRGSRCRDLCLRRTRRLFAAFRRPAASFSTAAPPRRRRPNDLHAGPSRPRCLRGLFPPQHRFRAADSAAAPARVFSMRRAFSANLGAGPCLLLGRPRTCCWPRRAGSIAAGKRWRSKSRLARPGRPKSAARAADRDPACWFEILGQTLHHSFFPPPRPARVPARFPAPVAPSGLWRLGRSGRGSPSKRLV